MESLASHVERLMRLGPSFVTCTYGAGGSTRSRTLEVVAEVREKHQIPVATHLTCVGSTADELCDYLQRAWELEVRNVVALRGDPPQGEKTFQAVAGGFAHANELVAFIRQEFPDMGIAVGGYPEVHQEAPSPAADLANLKRKVDAGADVVLTQLFYDNADYFAFCNRCREIGITVPIVPGLLPVTNSAQVQRISALCGAKLPADFVAALEKHEVGSLGQYQVGVEFAVRQVSELLFAGVPGIHFYVLNKADATEQVLRAVQLPR